MIRKILLSVSVAFLLCFVGTIFPVNASDTWFYQDSSGAQYYLRKADRTRSWVGGCVVKVEPNGRAVSMLYQFEYFPKMPYSIYYGDNFAHMGKLIEKGFLYGDGIANPSAKILYENYLEK